MGLLSARKMLKESVGPENDRLIEAHDGLDARRPCGHTAIPIDE